MRLSTVTITATLSIWCVTLFATNPGDGGPAIQAAIDRPLAIAVDGSKTLYIAEGFRKSIRRVDLNSGIITTVVTKAPLNGVCGMTVDPFGDLILAAVETVRKVRVSDGTVSAIAGKPGSRFGGDAGPAIDAGVSALSVSVDDAGNLYIAGGERIRRVDARTGLITTVAGGRFDSSGDGGPALNAGLFRANSVAIDGSGNLFIAQGDGGDSYRIRRVDAKTGLIQTIAGPGQAGELGDGGPAIAAHLRPVGLALKRNGDLLIVDGFSSRVRLIDGRTQLIRTSAGTKSGFGGDGGLAEKARLAPLGIALDSEENIYIADFLNNRIRRVDAHTGVIQTIAGNGRPNRPPLGRK